MTEPPTDEAYRMPLLLNAFSARRDKRRALILASKADTCTASYRERAAANGFAKRPIGGAVSGQTGEEARSAPRRCQPAE